MLVPHQRVVLRKQGITLMRQVCQLLVQHQDGGGGLPQGRAWMGGASSPARGGTLGGRSLGWRWLERLVERVCWTAGMHFPPCLSNSCVKREGLDTLSSELGLAVVEEGRGWGGRGHIILIHTQVDRG